MSEKADIYKIPLRLNRAGKDDLEILADHFGVSYVEAMRRALSISCFLIKQTQKGCELQVEERSGRTQKIVLL